MHDAGDFRPAHGPFEHRRPGRVRIEQCHAGRDQQDDAEREQQVRPSPHGAPTLIIAAFALRQRVGAHMRARLLLLAVAIFAVEPKRRMDPEEQQHAADRQVHEFRGEPRVGIMSEVVGRGMRLERREARCRVRWHFWQVFSRLAGATLDAGSLARRIAWLPWQSEQVAPLAKPMATTWP